jgi:transcription-repair coupling factor (superfamily II helicase)
MLDKLIAAIQAHPGFKDLTDSLARDANPPRLGLLRAARLPVIAALHASLSRPILLFTDRTDRAMALADELALWAPSVPRMLFPEPAPLFYEPAPWGKTTRHDRLKVLAILAERWIPHASRVTNQRQPPPILIAPARSLMMRTMPRRDFLKNTQTLTEGFIGTACPSLGVHRLSASVRRGGIRSVLPPGRTAGHLATH